MTFAPPMPDKDGCCPTCGQPFTIAAMPDALSAERARVIEMCVRVADIAASTNVIGWNNNDNRVGRIKAGEIAAALRALGQQDTGQS